MPLEGFCNTSAILIFRHLLAVLFPIFGTLLPVTITSSVVPGGRLTGNSLPMFRMCWTFKTAPFCSLVSLQLETQEAKESEDSALQLKKGGAKVKGPGQRKLMLAAETLPSPKGRRIEPVIDPELKKKIEKAVQQKENKGKRVSFQLDQTNGHCCLDNMVGLLPPVI